MNVYKPAQDVVVLRVQVDVVLLDVSKKLIRAKHFGNLNELVVIVVAMEEGLLAEDLSFSSDLFIIE